MSRFEISADEANIRIDLFLTQKINDLTRNACHRYIANQAITVNNRPVAKNYKLRVNDTVSVDITKPVPYTAEPENIPLDIVYEDSHIIVVNKPRGMVVHPAAGHGTGTLVNALLYHAGGSLSGINGIMRPGIVHRLDKDTSGLLVVAKHDRAHHNLTAQWAENTITRIYHALCFYNIKEDRFTINKPIGRHPVHRKKMAVYDTVTNKNSRQAVTHVHVLEKYKTFTLLEARLETGRTHQIRVHLAALGHPILGDSLYGKDKQPFNLNGQILHAKSLSFNHPINLMPLTFDSEWPDYFKTAVSKANRI